MPACIIFTRPPVRRPPMTGENFFSMTVLVNNCVDRERRLDHRRDPLAFFIDGVPVKQARADALSPSTSFEIERQHVRRCNRFCGSQSRTDRLSPAGKACKVMETDRAGDDDFREFPQRAIYFDWRAAIHASDFDELRRTVRIVIQGANALRDKRCEQLDLFIRPDDPMNSGRENNRNVAWLNSVLD